MQRNNYINRYKCRIFRNKRQHPSFSTISLISRCREKIILFIVIFSTVFIYWSSVPKWFSKVKFFELYFRNKRPLSRLILKSKSLALSEVIRQYPEAYSEACQTSKVKRFAKIVNGWEAVNYFRKTFHLRCFTEFWISFWYQLLNRVKRTNELRIRK